MPAATATLLLYSVLLSLYTVPPSAFSISHVPCSMLAVWQAWEVSSGGSCVCPCPCLYSCSCPCHCSPTPLLPYSPAPVPPERTASATSIFDSRVRAPTAHCTMCTGYCALLLGTVCCALCALYWVLGMAARCMYIQAQTLQRQWVGVACNGVLIIKFSSIQCRNGGMVLN